MRKILFLAVCLGLLVQMTVSADENGAGPATIGKTAPAFTLQGADGKKHSLDEFKGKYVVLEWTNPNCPFVHKFYDSGSMQKFQKEETGQGVIWLRINSSAKGHDGYQSAADVTAYEKENGVASTATLLDPSGKVGHLYGAKTTPHMFVINPQGMLIYAGGIDNKPSADPEDIASAENYVTTALSEAKAGKPVATATARSYGCSIKYAN